MAEPKDESRAVNPVFWTVAVHSSNKTSTRHGHRLPIMGGGGVHEAPRLPEEL